MDEVEWKYSKDNLLLLVLGKLIYIAIALELRMNEMKIEFNSSGNRAKVVEPTFEAKNIYLDGAILTFLREQNKLISLEKMNFNISFSQRQWEISDEPPTGTPGTVASLIFSVGGSLQDGEHSDEIICILS
jgi:hypothetical protein